MSSYKIERYGGCYVWSCSEDRRVLIRGDYKNNKKKEVESLPKKSNKTERKKKQMNRGTVWLVSRTNIGNLPVLTRNNIVLKGRY